MTPGAIIWLSPYWFFLFPLLALGMWGVRYLGEQGESASLLSDQPVRQQVVHPWRILLQGVHRQNAHRRTLNVIYAIVVGLIITALAQPARIGERLPDPPQARDIVFLVDTSVSMILRDYVLNGQRVERMSMLKGVLDRFVPELEGNRVSVIVFGESTYTYVPFTFDLNLVRRMLSRIEVTMAGRFNALGDAMALAIKQAEASPAKQRILVVFADTYRSTGVIAPEAAAALAAEAKIPIYTVAIGASSFAADEQREIGLLYDPVNLQLLKEIADTTHAHMYRAGDAGSLQQAIHDIGLHEKIKREVKPQYYHEPLYFWPLGLAMVLLLWVQALSLLPRKAGIA